LRDDNKSGMFSIVKHNRILGDCRNSAASHVNLKHAASSSRSMQRRSKRRPVAPLMCRHQWNDVKDIPSGTSVMETECRPPLEFARHQQIACEPVKNAHSLDHVSKSLFSKKYDMDLLDSSDESITYR
jgi:hypothetical protein